MAAFRGYDLTRLGDSTLLRRTLVFALTVGAFCTALLWLLQLRAAAPYRTLLSEGRRTDAVVTFYRPDARDDLRYGFSLGAREYTGGSSSHSSGSYTVGQALWITYAASDPTINCACDPQTVVSGDEVGALIGGAFVALGAAGIFLTAYPMIRPR